VNLPNAAGGGWSWPVGRRGLAHPAKTRTSETEAKTVSELDEALALADRLLDEPMADPDDDLRMLSRQLQRTHEAAGHYMRHRDQVAAHNERLVKILSAITLCLPPPPVKLDDGRTMQFVDPDPARTLHLLQRSIEQARSAIVRGGFEADEP
jgi:hypothetical protein